MQCQGCMLTNNKRIRRRMELADKAHSVISKARTTQVWSTYIYIAIHVPFLAHDLGKTWLLSLFVTPVKPM